MRAYCTFPHAMRPAAFDALRTAVLRSPLIGDTQLTGGFAASRGFSLVFRAEGTTEVRARFAALGPYLDALEAGRGLRALRGGPAWLHTRLPRAVRDRLWPAPNAFYLNVLVVPGGGGIEPHVDATLRSYTGGYPALPLCVSVLYLAVPPDMDGGQLWLADDEVPIARHTPTEGTWLHFRGDLKHAVLPHAAAAPRVSLVCEQYHLPPHVRSRVPAFSVHSRAPFAQRLSS